MALHIEEGQVVWVTVGETHEEPALVLKTGCTYTDQIVDTDVAVSRNDGVLVQLSVSMIKGIYPVSKLRPMEALSSRKRSTRQQKPSRSSSEVPKGPIEGVVTSIVYKTPRSSIHARSTVTPSPTSTTVSSSGNNEDQAMAAVSTALAASAKKSNSTTRLRHETSGLVSSKPAPKDPSKFKTQNEVTEVNSTSSEEESDKEDVKLASFKYRAKKVQPPPAKKPKVIVVGDSSDDSDPEEVVDNNNDEEEDDDKPFTIESSPTGRATCRRCDQVIRKGILRVSHTPLFRGKPGYKVYRHLDCTIFSEEVMCVQDVGGWSKLDTPSLERLRQRIVSSRQELEEENREIQPDELVQLAFSGPMRPSPEGLTGNLLPFQVEGASWMYAHEHSEVRGGILADEMGMGKTIQTIVTILDNRPKLQHTRPGTKHPPLADDLESRIQEDAKWQAAAHEWRHEMEMNNVSRKIWPKGAAAAARAGTLVVCPVIALSQWKSEIEKFTAHGSLSVGIYHGPDREKQMPRELMSKYDVVLTTYQVLEQDFRKMVSPNKVSCPNCGAKFKIDKLRVHLKYFCGEGAQRTEAQMRQHRTTQRPGRNNDEGGNGKKGSQPGKKPPMPETKLPPKTKTKPAQAATKAAPTKSKIKIQSVEGYESDSDLSIEVVDKYEGKGSRPSRSAAIKASRRVSASFKEWNGDASSKQRNLGDVDDDDDSYSDDVSSADESDDSFGMSIAASAKKTKPTPKPATVTKKSASKTAAARKRSRCEDDSDDDDSHDGLEDETLARARARQQQALDAARRGKKGVKDPKAPMDKKNGKDNKSKGKKGGNNKAAATSKKKKFDDESSSDDSSDDDDDIDPLAGIDMDELKGEAMAGARFSVLHGFTWWRCVLDEAHFIKSRNSQTAASAFALTSVHRWCLSGTPLQNRVGELYSLIRFVRLDPMAHYFCRQCTCKSIHYRMEQGVCQDCGHRAFSHFSHFNKHVLNPIQRDGYTGDGRRAMFILKSDVLDKCLLRRTKENRAEDMNLPPRLVTIRPVRLHPVEEDFYNALYTQTKSSFDDYVAEGTLLNNYAHIFDLLTKMRQAVNHPYLIVYSNSDKVRALHQPQRQMSAPVANGSVDCDMCHEPPEERVVSSCCGAGFCRSCVIEYLTGAVGDNTPCPSCSRPFTIDLNQASVDDEPPSASVAEDTNSLPATSPSTVKASSSAGSQYSAPSLKQLSHVSTGSILRRINLAEFATSTKIEVLVQELTEMRQKRPGSKALVFSQFVNMLDLIRWRLHSDPCLAHLGLGVRILHGGMDVKSRDAALKDFREDPNCRVLLMSLKAAGVALNLTVASECFLTDLWWNPAAEMQAIDRTHRLGQYRPIRAVRLVAEGTVEERVLQLQEKKRLVFDGTIGRDAGSLKMLTVDDMVQLFS